MWGHHNINDLDDIRFVSLLFGYRCGYQAAAQRQDSGAGRKFLTYSGSYLHTTPPLRPPMAPNYAPVKHCSENIAEFLEAVV